MDDRLVATHVLRFVRRLRLRAINCDTRKHMQVADIAGPRAWLSPNANRTPAVRATLGRFRGPMPKAPAINGLFGWRRGKTIRKIVRSDRTRGSRDGSGIIGQVDQD